MKAASILASSSSSSSSASPWQAPATTTTATGMTTSFGGPLPTTGQQQQQQTVEEYAQSVLESYAQSSSASAPPDDSLGSYVTSVLRNELAELDNDHKEYSMELVELLEEHCNLSNETARKALQEIAHVVRHGVGRAPPPPLSLDMQNLLTALPDTVNVRDESQGGNAMVAAEQASARTRAVNNAKSVISPLHEDNLIPGDLLGALDESAEQQRIQCAQPTFGSSPVLAPSRPAVLSSLNNTDDEAFPPLGAAASGAGKKKGKAKRSDVSSGGGGSSSVDELTAPTSHSSSGEGQVPNSLSVQGADASELPQSIDYYYYSYQATVESLLMHYPELSEEAATAAASYHDLSLALYLADAAFTAPPVCRHLLNDGCYRSDCQFSHDIEGHTCIFWLRGRCGKGESCRFQHGFNESLLQDYYDSIANASNAADTTAYASGDAPLVNPLAYPAVDASAPSKGSWEPASGSAEQISHGAPAPGPSSFANIASQGYRPTSFVNSTSQAGPSSSKTQAPTVKIPQDLWTPHESRDASAFGIADPMERYWHVSSTVTRQDVIDLHFQSTQTFWTVLSAILPQKLRQMEKVWIVTGTGHHVGSRTHQKGGGALENAVVTWLEQEGYVFSKGRDRNGQGGAILVELT